MVMNVHLDAEQEFYKDLKENSTLKKRRILGLEETDPIAFSNKYFNKKLSDISIDPNANVGGISPNNYLSEIAKPFAKHYFFRKLFEKGRELFDDFSLKHIYEGDVYMHDSTKLQPYCFGVSATEIATEGRPYSILPANPPKRFESFMGQMTEYIMDCSQEFAGAIAVTDLVPWMAWFIEKGKGKGMYYWNGDCNSPEYKGHDDIDIDDKDIEDIEITNEWSNTIYPNRYSNKDIENIFQSFVHVLNNSFRVGGDSPFSNISVNSKKVYYDIFDHYTFPDGKTIDDLWETIKRVQKIIVEFMSKGQPNGLPYRFPVLTANFKASKEEADSDWFRYLAEKNAKGFMNINFAERFAMCCRLSLDFDFKQNSFGGGGVKVGSMRVTNINLPRLALKAKNHKLVIGNHADVEQVFLDNVEFYIDKSIEYLIAYSKVFEEMIDSGYLKFFKEPNKWFDKNMFFATVGFCGIWDAASSIHTKFEDIVRLMEMTIDIFVEKTKGKSNGLKFNVEEVPSESAAGTMCKMNRDYGETKDYYSNQFVPLSENISIPTRIDIESRLQSKLTGGGMTFLNYDAELTPEQSYEIHKYMLDKGFIGQFCVNYGYSSDGEHTTVGKVDKCPICGKPTEFYTRVVGYFAKQKNTSSSKKMEISDRIWN